MHHAKVSRRYSRFCLCSPQVHVRHSVPACTMALDSMLFPTTRAPSAGDRRPLTVKSCASDASLSVRLAIVENFPPADNPCWKRKCRGFDSPPGACCCCCCCCCLLCVAHLKIFVSFALMLNRWLLVVTVWCFRVFWFEERRESVLSVSSSRTSIPPCWCGLHTSHGSQQIGLCVGAAVSAEVVNMKTNCRRLRGGAGVQKLSDTIRERDSMTKRLSFLTPLVSLTC